MITVLDVVRGVIVFGVFTLLMCGSVLLLAIAWSFLRGDLK